MGESNGTRRLLCTWHLIKNWNIQEKNKIWDPDMKKGMKNELKRILNETRLDRFEELSRTYFLKPEVAGEIDFLNYLKKYMQITVDYHFKIIFICYFYALFSGMKKG